jgi:hypothetical protein
MTTVTTLLAIAFTVISAVALINVLTFLYARSVIRSAVDEAVRAGSRAGAGVAVCDARAEDALDTLLGGPLGDEVSIICEIDPTSGDLVAVADATLRSPLPGFPPWTFSMRGQAVQEAAP